ncbi:hypothetical protein Zmor_026996 [Zophobas morio]|uniref:Serpin domain-containing protein n=1 Tax=Zophobas morio TaxID=2755281 RepID=A0AA38M4Z5_9CUCU|nr:hypothetical protein Zmor_026996 [Zophobas morio]
METPEQLIRNYVGDTVTFATATYKHLRKTPNTNFVSSPFSMEIFLILLRLGAKGATAHELRTQLRQSTDLAKMESSVKTLISMITQGGFYTFILANKLYVKDGCAIKESFKTLTEQMFSAYVENLDFNNPNSAAKLINAWIKNQTMGNIDDVISGQQLTSSSRLVLVNSVYMNTMWNLKFTKEVATRTKFFTAENETVGSEYMVSRGCYKYYVYKTVARIVEIKFLSDEGAMFIVLPNTREGLAEVEDVIAEILNVSVDEYQDAHVKIELPEFKLSSLIDFKSVLEECGVKKLFQASEADLSGIAGGKGDLHVDAIFQKVHLKIDERGLETTKKGPTPWHSIVPFIPATEKIVEFIVEHPFIFFIKIEDVVVFVGRVVNPSL